MEPVSSGTPPSGGSATAPDGELTAAFRELRSAVARREAEHARRDRNRAVFSRVVLVLILGILVGVYALVATFDPKVFQDSLREKVSHEAPSILRSAKTSVTSLLPTYQQVVAASWPAFTQSLSDKIAVESSKLADTITPVVRGDATIYTGEADGELAKHLASRFGKTFRNGSEARPVATALRSQEMLATQTVLDNELAGPFTVLRDMKTSLDGMGAPDKELMGKGDTTEALGNAALDVVKAKLTSGEGWGILDDKDGKKGAAKKGGK